MKAANHRQPMPSIPWWRCRIPTGAIVQLLLAALVITGGLWCCADESSETDEPIAADSPTEASVEPRGDSPLPVEGAAGGRGLAGTAGPSTRWPDFRGPTGQGHAEPRDLPLTWSDSEHIAWKVPVPGAGWSSPVIDGNDIWLTTATESGKNVRAVCFNRQTGKIAILSKALFEIDKRMKVLAKNGHASPSPLIDGERVFVHFGAHGTACLDRQGNVVWKRVLPYYHHHGPGASPVLAGDTLVVVCDGFTGPFYDKHVREGVDNPQFVVGLDVATGEIRWKTSRPGRHSYCTPLVIEVAGRQQVVCPGGDKVWAYDPADGTELWSCKYEGYSVVPRPVFAQGLIFVCTGYDTASLLAIREGGSGDITYSHVAWRLAQGIPFISSPIAVGDHLYFVHDTGILNCVELQTGRIVYKQRLGGHFASSPIVVGDRLYVASEEGVVHVVRPGPQFEELARNQLKAKFLASPAVAGNRLYLRSEKHLYCVADESLEVADIQQTGGATEKPFRGPAVRPASTVPSR